MNTYKIPDTKGKDQSYIQQYLTNNLGIKPQVNDRAIFKGDTYTRHATGFWMEGEHTYSEVKLPAALHLDYTGELMGDPERSLDSDKLKKLDRYFRAMFKKWDKKPDSPWFVEFLERNAHRLPKKYDENVEY